MDMVISGFDYSPSIQKEWNQADLIISHAGIYPFFFANVRVRSILEALHLGSNHCDTKFRPHG
jgi:UDP-N-acetylglucosamine transferase subunit ALG13